jgi:hypothetical protein
MSSTSSLIRKLRRPNDHEHTVLVGHISTGGSHVQPAKGFTPCRESAYYSLGYARETKSTTASCSTTTSVSTATDSNTSNDNSDDGGDDGGGGEDGGGDDDDPADILLLLPVAHHIVSFSSFPFLSSMLLAGMAWLFKDSFLAAIPLIGLCALCAFPDKLQFLKAEVSPKGGNFEIRGKNRE